MSGTYHPLLVTASFVVAALASFTALELSRRVATTDGRASTVWLVSGAFSMGVGIWSMHFVGMLAFRMEMPFSYDLPMTIVSMFVGIVASGFAIYVASRKRQSTRSLVASAVILGAGIASMHYTGMDAMRMPARTVYDPVLVTASVAIAVVAGGVAIWIAFTLARRHDRRARLYRGAAAIVMGLAICGMHYTGMAAASYVPIPAVMDAMTAGIVDNDWLAVGVVFATFVLLGTTHLTIYFDFRLGQQRSVQQALSAKLRQQVDDLRERERELDREVEQRRAVESRALQLSRILDESAYEIYLFDAGTLRFLKVNFGAQANLGYSKDRLLEMTPLDLKPDFDRQSFDAMIEPLRDGATRRLLFETVHRRADGSCYPVEVHLQFSAAGTHPVFVAFIQDISARKALEGQLVQAQKLESIGQLASGIAHEINTPTQFVGDNTRFLKDAFEDLMRLHAVYAQLLEAARDGAVAPALIARVDAAIVDTDAEYLAEELPQALTQTQEGIDRIAGIVRAMKEFSHPGSDNKEEIDLNRAIRNTVTVAANEWKYVAEIDFDLDPDLPAVPCLPGEINQVVLNLVVNAAHAIEAARSDKTDDKGKIGITTRSNATHVEILISDTGTGIPPELVERIFDPFFTTKQVGKGTGQGLAIARSVIVTKHAGSLDVESQPGAGSTFTVRLPLAAQNTRKHQAA